MYRLDRYKHGLFHRNDWSQRHISPPRFSVKMQFVMLQRHEVLVKILWARRMDMRCKKIELTQLSKMSVLTPNAKFDEVVFNKL